MAPNRSSQRALLLSAALGLAQAVTVPEATAVPARVEVRAPIVTPAAVRFDGRYSYVERRDILDKIASGYFFKDCFTPGVCVELPGGELGNVVARAEFIVELSRREAINEIAGFERFKVVAGVVLRVVGL